MRNFPSKGGGEPQLTLSGTLRAYLCHQGSGDGNDIKKMQKNSLLWLQCPFEWFHFSCFGITRKTREPKGYWYCD